MKLSIQFDSVRGKRYEDEYGGYIRLLKSVATREQICLVGPPLCWVPWLLVFGCEYRGAKRVFAQDEFVDEGRVVREWKEVKDSPELWGWLETASSRRPELVDCLWKVENEWNVGLPVADHSGYVHLITSNSTFFRRPILDFIRKVDRWTKPGDKTSCVVVPCSADKPYPAPLHREVRAMLPGPEWHLLVASGTVGISPEELWDEMPLYDAGVPGEHRLFHHAVRYFQRNDYERIVVYADFYAPTILRALATLPCDTLLRGPEIDFVNELRFFENYQDLLDLSRLRRLEAVLRREPCR